MRPDEKKHFYLCMAISIFTLVLFRIEFDPIGWKYYHWYNWDAAVSALIGISIAIGKEIVWDKWLHKGTPQFYDAVWGSTGAMIGPGIVLFIEAIIVEVIPKIIN